MRKNLVIISLLILFMGLVLTFCKPSVSEACENWWTVCESQNYAGWPDYESKDEFINDVCTPMLENQDSDVRECVATRSVCKNIYETCGLFGEE